MEETSRLDEAIRQRQILGENGERFWFAVWQAVERTAKKLADHFHQPVQVTLDDSNSLIEVEAAFKPNTQEIWIKRRPRMQIRFDRSLGRIVVQQSDSEPVPMWNRPLDYLMKANVETQDLSLVRKGTEYTPLLFVEKVLAEDLCKIKLEAS